MKSLCLFFISFILAQTSLAVKMLIKHPDSNQEEFQRYLMNHQDFSSFIDTIQQETLQQPTQEQKLFKIGEYLTTDPSHLLAQLEEMQRSESLSILSLQYLQDMSVKYLQSDFQKSYKEDFIQLYCKTHILRNDEPSLYPCVLQSKPLNPIVQKHGWVEKILIESKAIRPTDSIIINESTSYQWKLLSNTHHPVEFYGTYKELVQKEFKTIEFARGTCESFTGIEHNLNLKKTKSIFFSPDCVKEFSSKTTQKSFFEKKYAWVYAITLLAVSGSVFYLKDKTLTITY